MENLREQIDHIWDALQGRNSLLSYKIKDPKLFDIYVRFIEGKEDKPCPCDDLEEAIGSYNELLEDIDRISHSCHPIRCNKKTS